jgi:HlyD family secretion protein
VKKTLLTLVVAAVIAGSAYGFYNYRKAKPAPAVATAQITRGDIVDTVGATGTLQAVTTVQVGTQVSGTILSLYADFNSLVRKGQVLARLDPSLFQTQIEQAQANLLRAQASLNQNKVNLDHTVINAPIDGLVISRNVDVGQTVAASMQAPTLFVLAADLTKMQVVANLDESDVGRIRPRQEVSFRVDAYPTETFRGAVSQVRLNPLVQQNVVTYATVIDVPNNELKLKPGMTANVNIEIARRTDVLRVPNSALRFRPTPEMYAALGLAAPEANQRSANAGGAAGGAAGGSRRGGSGGSAAATSGAGKVPAVANPAAPDGATPTQPLNTAESSGRNGDGMPAAGSRRGGSAAADPAPTAGDEGGGRGRFAERTQNMSPEQRAQMLQRMRDRGIDPDTARGRRGNAEAATGTGVATADSQRGRGHRAAPDAAAPPLARGAGATTIDALFGPLPVVETTGRVWVYADKRLEGVRLRLGVSDGQTTELIEGPVTEGTAVVTNIALGDTRPAATNGFPFGQPGRGGFPGGGFPGGGGNRGGGGGANRGGGR